MNSSIDKAIDQKKKKKSKGIIALIMVAVIAIGGTLAYLSTMTEKADNVFTFSNDIKARLEEPNWNPKDGEDIKPGREIPKDPQIFNTSTDAIDEYVAMKLVFRKGDGTAPVVMSAAEMKTLMQAADIDWNTVDGKIDNDTMTAGGYWFLAKSEISDYDSGLPSDSATGTAVFYYVYSDILQKGQTTQPIFTHVNISADQDKYLSLAGGNIHNAECYDWADCDCSPETVHHPKCASLLETPGTCDCTPALHHEDTCKSMDSSEGVLTCTDSAHTIAGLGGFDIYIAGAAVQTEGFANAQEASVELLKLLADSNVPVDATTTPATTTTVTP